jgi:ligand-binding sensor domain-containing protein/signal transduction histidine kinase
MRKLLLNILLTFAITPGIPAQLLPIRNYTTRDGLNANSINAVLRDSKGMLWVGTYNGVNWYDGTRFLQPSMSTRSGQIYVTHLMEDRNHQVWVASWYSGLYKYANGTFSNYLPDSAHIGSQANSITALTELDSGRYLAGTDRNAWLFDGRRFLLLDPANTLLDQQIHSILYTRNGDILIGLPQGLAWYRKSGRGWTYAGLLLKGLDINRLSGTGDEAWFTCPRGLFYLSSVSAFLEGRTSPRLLLSEPVDNVFPGAGANCWYTQGNTGASLLHNGRLARSISRNNGLPSSFVTIVYPDAEGIIWLGTEYGLAKLTPGGYRFFPVLENTDVDVNVIAIEKDAAGGLWLGTYDGLYRMQDGIFREVRQPNDFPCGFVFTLFRDHRNRLWACTASGIYLVERDRLKRYQNAIAIGITEDDAGDLWFGCSDGRILRLNDDSAGPGDRHFHEMAQADRIDERISGIYRDKAGSLWAGYALDGIRKFGIQGDSLKLIKAFTRDYGNLLVRAMHGDEKGRLLVGTRTGGLYIFDSTGATGPPLTMDKGLSGNWIKGIASGAGGIFLATNNGLDVISPSSSQVRHINFSDGLVPTELNTVCLEHDTVWLGTAKGVLEYTPGGQLHNTLPPPVYCMRAIINGRPDSSFRPFSRDSRLPRLSYTQNNLAFDFAGLSFRNESGVSYRYRLEGLDKDWNLPTDRRYVNYGNLPPGDYRFLVVAANDDGIWSSQPASVSFTIAAPFWRTTWFIGLCALLTIAVVYSIYRLRLHQLLRIERLRHRISTDLHDDIGSTLSSISILSDMALQEETAPEMITQIRDHSLSLLDKMDDIVWSINPRNDTLESLLLRIRRFSAQLFEARGIEYEIDIQPDIRHLKLQMADRQHVYLILKEAINNLIKHSGARKACILVHAVRRSLVVRISDDGRGFKPDTDQTGNGIINMKNRAANMKAALHIDTTPGYGTIVTLMLKNRN